MVIAGWWLLRTRNAPISIAVLPLVNLSQDAAHDYSRAARQIPLWLVS